MDWKPITIALGSVCLVGATPIVAGERALPEDNLNYAVLLTVGSSQGSGFFRNTRGAVYLVTAKHVLGDPSSGARYSDRAVFLCRLHHVGGTSWGCDSALFAPGRRLVVFGDLQTDPDRKGGVRLESNEPDSFLELEPLT